MKARVGQRESELEIESQNELEVDLLLSWMEKQPKITGHSGELGIHPRYGPSQKKIKLIIEFEDTQPDLQET